MFSYRAKINVLLEILDNIVVASSRYTLTLNEISEVKELNGSSFRLFSPDGLATLRIKLANTRKPLEHRQSNTVVDFSLLEAIESMTQDLFIISGALPEELGAAYEAVYGSCCNALTDPQLLSILDNPQSLSFFKNNPWAFTLLLLELLPTYRVSIQLPPNANLTMSK